MCQESYWESKVKNNRMIMWHMHLLSEAYIPLFYPLHIIIAFSEAIIMKGAARTRTVFSRNSKECF